MAPPAEGRRSRYLRFIVGVTIAHFVTYIAAGTIAFFFVYESAIEAAVFDPTLRSPNNPDEWQHVTNWLFFAEILRGMLFGVALCPFLSTLSTWRMARRFSTLLLLLFVFSVWSVPSPAPGSIEGWLYLRPDSGLELDNPWLGYVEVPTQLAAFSWLVSWWVGRQTRKEAGEPTSG